MPQPYKLFIIYAREDAAYLKELRGQLKPLEYAGRIQVWSDREINPGMDWEQEIVHNLDTADIILILVSAAYYDSAYIHEKEIKYALSRHEKGEAKVLPIIVRPCSFLDDPVISRLQVLPTDGIPVTDRRHWQERDDAWLDVVGGLKRTLDNLTNQENQQKAAVQKADQQQKDWEEQEHLNRLRTEREELARNADASAWQLAVDSHTESAYQSYLKGFPNGKMAAEARLRIKDLKKRNIRPSSRLKYGLIVGAILVLGLIVWLWSQNSAARNSGDYSQKSFNVDSIERVEKTPVVENETFKKSGKASSATALPAQSNAGISSRSGLDMLPVEGGTFTMGAPATDPNHYSNECQHQVSVKSFSLGKYEITQADWLKIMGRNPSYHKDCMDCPVENVSWNDIQLFLSRLNAKHPNLNYRLPSESEWEFAARGGKNSPYNYYSGSDNLNEVMWFEGNSGGKTQPVGSKSPNRLGFCDMSGNVWEWCQDTYEPYPCDQNGAAKTGYRIFRGGSAFDKNVYGRVAFRNSGVPQFANRNIGFRLASDLQK